MTDKEKKLEEWLKLVHEGACCSHSDPQKEEKEKFLNSLKKEENKEKEEAVDIKQPLQK